MFRSMCRHGGPMTTTVELDSVAFQCCSQANFSLLRSSALASPSNRRCAACSISRCRHCVRCAASRAGAAVSVRRAGRNCRSSRGPIASSWARPSSMTPDRAFCRWKRSPIRWPIIALAPRCVSTRFSRALVHALKYGDRLDLAPMMGRWIGQAGRELLAEADALVPVPLHWRRLWARRFNQSAMLAAAVSRQAGVPVAAEALKRVKPTAQPVGLSRTERAANVQGAFRVPGDGKAAVTGRRLVLIDDVLTSGATVEGCGRALLRAGAANVDVLVFARVAEPARTSI